MKDALTLVNKWLGDLIELFKMLVVIGVIVGILFDDYFGVIAGIGKVVGQFGDGGLAGLLALIIIALWYQKK
ncbi:MAG: EscU/YscU/HrcU family type III secretion system export apparatus switch protein [FCB group bacterium]|nr:EscU/YscU/HrcU family type III secretion system export apparatus switch protein [FCB group bacterium]